MDEHKDILPIPVGELPKQLKTCPSCLVIHAHKGPSTGDLEYCPVCDLFRRGKHEA